MSCRSMTPRIPRRSALSVSLAMGIGLSLGVAAGAATPDYPAKETHAFGALSLASTNTSAASKGGQRSQPSQGGPRPTTPHVVSTCADDDSSGSLRAIIASPNTADGDTIDLSQLMCSTITLDATTHTPAHITIAQPSLNLIDPGAGSLTIHAAPYSGVLRHSGNGTLHIEGMTIAYGNYSNDNNPFGGCIYSTGSVDLKNARVDVCAAYGAGSVTVAGGAVMVKHDLTMDHSALTHGYAVHYPPPSAAHGGGAYVGGNLQISYSTISSNWAYGGGGGGGGAFVAGSTINITSSTISGNHAAYTGGLVLSNGTGMSVVSDSTISGNVALYKFGGMYAYTSGSLDLANSTVAFNRDDSASYGGVNFTGAELVLESSIIAGNGSRFGEADLYANAGILSGSNNLVVAAAGAALPGVTIHNCPKLGPLMDNGGATLTHAPSSTSPAIDAGSSPATLVFDQSGYLRVEGAQADIGSLEWRSSLVEDRIFVAGFDGLCDQ
jgi:hypothetical protein